MEKIRQFMIALVDHEITNEMLKKQIIEFIDYKSKEEFPFAQLVVFHYHLFGGKEDDIIKIAAGMELLILAIDILDDFMDQDNQDPPWMKIESSTTIHIATILNTLCQLAIDESFFHESLKKKAKAMLNRHILRCLSGQICDNENRILSEQDYFILTKEKSGSLISCACLLGTIFSNDKYASVVKQYAEHFGIAVQIANDIRDILRENDKNDLLHKKKTLPILFSLNNQDPKLSVIREYYEGNISIERIKEEQKELIESIEASGAIAYAKVHMQFEINKAKEIIAEMNISQEDKNKIQNLLFE